MKQIVRFSLIGLLVAFGVVYYFHCKGSSIKFEEAQFSSKKKQENLPHYSKMDSIKKINVSKTELEHTKASEKFDLDFKLLLKLNPDLQALNPEVDFSKLSLNDPIWKSIKIPKNTKYIALKDPNCSVSTLQNVGASKENSLTSAVDSTMHESFISLTSESEQSLGELSLNINSNPCIKSLSANGSIDSVRLPQNTKDLAKLLPPGTKDVPQIFNLPSLIQQGAGALKDNLISSRENAAVQVFMVGQDLAALGLPDNLNPAEPGKVSNQNIPENMLNVSLLPMPKEDSSEQIASVNNGIIFAIQNGANMVMVPLIDPNVIAPATKYAAEHGASIVMVPREVRLSTKHQEPTTETRAPAAAE